MRLSTANHLVAAILALTPALALAQIEEGTTNDCVSVEGIAGSVPYRIAALALQGNSQLYGATAIIDEQVLHYLGAPVPEETPNQENAVAFSYRINQMYGVLDVPTVEQNGSCPRDYKYSERPLDMASSSFGYGYQWRNGFGLFYGASVSYSWLAADNAALRGMLSWSGSIYSMYPAIAAPFFVSDEPQKGLVFFSTDYIAGFSYNFGLATAALGYVGSQGIYARLGGADVGGFISSVINGDEGLATLDLSLGPFDLGPVTPAFRAQRRALIAPGRMTDTGKTASGVEGDAWSNATLELRDVGGYLDAGFTWMFEPEMMWSAGTLALHSPGFHQIHDDPHRTNIDVGYLIRGGALNRPEMRYYGLADKVLFSLVVEVRYMLDGLAIVLAGAWNDPRRLDLFPFAQNHFAIDYAVEATF